MLAQPAVCALLIAWRWHWSVLPTLIVAAAMFLVREPLIVLARQKYVWRDPKPETPIARRWIVALAPIIALSGSLLLLRWQLTWLTAFAFGSLALTAYAVWMTVHNRQRSIRLQIVSAFGLTSTGLAVSLSLLNSITTWACWLWLLSAAQAAAGILLVHARLEARIAAKTRKTESVAFFRAAAWMQAALIPLGLLAGFLSYWLTAAMLLPAAVHAYELKTLHTPAAMATPLRTIGFRAMGLSIAVSLLLVIGLR